MCQSNTPRVCLVFCGNTAMFYAKPNTSWYAFKMLETKKERNKLELFALLRTLERLGQSRTIMVFLLVDLGFETTKKNKKSHMFGKVELFLI